LEDYTCERAQKLLLWQIMQRQARVPQSWIMISHHKNVCFPIFHPLHLMNLCLFSTFVFRKLKPTLN